MLGNKKIRKGIIASVQMAPLDVTKWVAQECVNAGVVAIRTDKNIFIKDVPIIGLKKIKVKDKLRYPYITPTITEIEEVAQWADYVAIDFRRINKNLKEIDKYCRHNQIKVVADIMDIDDYKNIKDNDFLCSYITDCFSVISPLLTKPYFPDNVLIEKLLNEGCKNLIAEGNYSSRQDVRKAFNIGVDYVCIGTAIFNPYKQTKKYTGIDGYYNNNLEEKN